MRLSLPRIIMLVLTISAASSVARAQSLIAAADGLYRFDGQSKVSRVLADVEVRKIVRLGDAFAFLTSRGVLFSRDMASFEERNAGLPIKTIKTFTAGVKGFAQGSAGAEGSRSRPVRRIDAGHVHEGPGLPDA